jgi:hypothetical protein
MSEYQFYEFRAIDRPLNPKELAFVRNTSSRAEITPTSFVNEYNLSTYRGDPDKLMEQYYDLHVYYASTGTVKWMLRLPLGRIKPMAIEAYGVDDHIETWLTKTHLILSLTHTEANPAETLEPRPWMNMLQQLRQDLLAGDYRLLYLAWLGAVAAEAVEEDQAVPLPEGLAKLTPALSLFAKVFPIPAAMLKPVTQASTVQAEPTEAELGSWIAELPVAIKDSLLLDICTGKRPTASADLLADFRRARKGAASQSLSPTAGELRAAAGISKS